MSQNVALKIFYNFHLIFKKFKADNLNTLFY